MKSVYSAVRTGSLNKAVCHSSFKGLMHTFLLSQFERLNFLYWLINDLTSISKPLATVYEITRRNSVYGLLVLTQLVLISAYRYLEHIWRGRHYIYPKRRYTAI